MNKTFLLWYSHCKPRNHVKISLYRNWFVFWSEEMHQLLINTPSSEIGRTFKFPHVFCREDTTEKNQIFHECIWNWSQILLEFGLFRLSVSLHEEIFRGRTFVLLGAHRIIMVLISSYLKKHVTNFQVNKINWTWCSLLANKHCVFVFIFSKN